MGAFNTIPPNPYPPSSEQQENGGGSQYVLPIASDETLGGVMVGDGLSINAETGELSNDNATPYELPIASDETLGGVMVGNGLSIDAETGELTNTNPTPYTPPAYSTTEFDTGKKWIDGKAIYCKVLTNVADQTTIATNVDTLVNVLIARHGASSDSNRHVFGDGFTINDGGSIYLNNTAHEAQYAVWASSGGSLDKTADHIIIEYTKTESEE
jgi:hypothetical protein